ncbi:DUF4476 domain-containing protein [Ferruginibacter albus]|uniref:DUF4476 domain-containing protein n=1 Tax=Ferruginibacter albus TaxID=2875540 RepID=UPI001CC3821D|nr:DUF4476 domain-containing protein [Ferruginibacter albus]UAY51533.1 DUF4476 domain-containing protein [Ferruginibacter albus]
MKLLKPALLIFSLFLVFRATAQQPHFVYIQTDNKQPFYVRTDKTIYSSTASGYVILGKLVDSTYNFSIGFPGNTAPQQNFTITVSKKDLGFLLKDFGEKGWGLFNLQTLDMVMANKPAPKSNVLVQERTDSFSNMLATVVNDPRIKQEEIIKKEEPVKEEITTATVAVKDTVPAPKEVKETIAVTPTPKSQTIVTRSTVKRLLNRTTAEGTEMVFVVTDDNKKDTVRVFIPADKSIAVTPSQPTTEIVKKEEPKPLTKVEETVQQKDTTATKASVVTQDKKFITDIEVPVAKAKTDTLTPAAKPIDKTVVTDKITGNDCKNIASDEDFYKLRKKMATEMNDEDMINQARKVFKTKCFNTVQIKNLSVLFLNDAGRYKFFTVAYSFTSDLQNFGSLQSQLTESSYINQFKALVNQ